MMEEEKKLYPLLFAELQDRYVWGTESFKLADLGYRDSVIRNKWLAANTLSEVMDTYIDRITGDYIYEYYGRQFPLCIKYIDVAGRMPLRVHPGDATAEERYDSLGKEKFWYVLKAGKNATVSLGFKKDTDASQLYEACSDGSVEGLLNTVSVHAGDCFHIKPGTVHCASGELRIAEVSESSALDFCLYAWGQPLGEEEFDPAMSIADALDFIDFKAYVHETLGGSKQEGPVTRLLELPEFTVSKVDLGNALHIFSEQSDSFLCYLCLTGKASVRIGEDEKYALNAGEATLIPAECHDFFLEPLEQGTELLEAMVEQRHEADPYINPSAEAVLPEER